MKRKTAAICTLALLLAFSAAYGWRQTTLAESYRQQVNSGYRKSLYETAELVESMRINLSKLMVTGSSANKRKLLAELALYAEGAQADLAALPENMSFSEGAVKFFNQVSDFSVSEVSQEGDFSDTVSRLLMTCASLSQELQAQGMRLEAGEAIFENAGSAAMEASEDTVQTAVKYPSLLYDGPFSDGRKDAQLLLSGETLTQEQAEEKARGYIGSSRVRDIALTIISNIQAPCYEFDVLTEDGTLSIAVTQQGGEVLFMLCDREPSTRNYSVGECVDFADRFLSQRGYGETRVSYWQTSGAVITVNFAAVQDNVVLYPDLLKVDVSMETGSVIGIEAVNYLSSHVPRSLPLPALTEAQAESLVSGELRIVHTRLCVIPLESGEESFCYEISALKDGEQYLIYIDAMTGDEMQLLKIMEDENGQLAV